MNVLQHKISTEKLKPGLVASHDIWPGNREGLVWFRHFINLSLTYLLKTAHHSLTAADPRGSERLCDGLVPAAAATLTCSTSSSSPSWNIFMKESHATAIMSRRTFIATFIGPMQSVCDIARMQTYMRAPSEHNHALDSSEDFIRRGGLRFSLSFIVSELWRHQWRHNERCDKCTQTK